METRTYRKGSRVGHVMQIISECEEALLKGLDGELKEVFKQFSAARTEMDYLSGTDKFIYGYRLGVMMTAEVFMTSDDMIHDGDDDF